jgi:hypothetical protein
MPDASRLPISPAAKDLFSPYDLRLHRKENAE